MTAPVYPGDTLYSQSEVIEVRASASRPTAGIVTVRTTGTNQDGKVVCVFERTILVPRKGHAVDE
jgi:acyl dehydratase